MHGVSNQRGPEIDGHRAALHITTPAGDVDGVVLVLHGGRSRSTSPTSPTQLAVVRMLPFGPAVERAAGEAGLQVAVARLRYRVRGWNGRRRDPVVDATWALEVLREQFGDAPIVLMGHSMGGRTALALADAPGVIGVVGLAPWVENGDEVGRVAGRRIDVLHGTADRMTDPRASRAWTEAAERRGATVDYTAVEGGKHAMLARAGWWHRTAAEAAVDQLRVALRTTASTGQDVPGSGSQGPGSNEFRSTTGSRRQS